jgi:D-glycerate 3-kinase
VTREETLDGLADWQQALLHRHQLQPDYLTSAQYWFDPLAERLVQSQQALRRPMLVGINGCQGSGKSTLCAYLELLISAKYQSRAVTLSLDDFYLNRSQRLALGQVAHPLLATRGVPGTHDMDLLREALDALLDPGREATVAVPRFDKATDSRMAEPALQAAVPDIVLLEGWCLGALPQAVEELAEPVNRLEADEDSEGTWRNFVNAALARDFLPLYARIDQWVMLQAPSFECVFEWRREQEMKLARARGARRGSAVMDDHQLARFIQHYERLTRACLERLPAQVDHLYQLDDQRHVRQCDLGRR